MDEAAYHGIAGDIVRAIRPHTEADPVAILVQTLASAGNAIGGGPYYQVEGDRHGPNIYTIVVGETAKGRKGTGAGRVRQIMEVADPLWGYGSACIAVGSLPARASFGPCATKSGNGSPRKRR
jgi:hypothetical protein